MILKTKNLNLEVIFDKSNDIEWLVFYTKYSIKCNMQIKVMIIHLKFLKLKFRKIYYSKLFKKVKKIES